MRVQLQHASTINAVGLRGAAGAGPDHRPGHRLPGVQPAQSDHGDRDSVGLFQQRPSQGWGTERQIMDPVYAAGKFYDALVQVPDWQNLPLTEGGAGRAVLGLPGRLRQMGGRGHDPGRRSGR